MVFTDNKFILSSIKRHGRRNLCHNRSFNTFFYWKKNRDSLFLMKEFISLSVFIVNKHIKKISANNKNLPFVNYEILFFAMIRTRTCGKYYLEIISGILSFTTKIFLWSYFPVTRILFLFQEFCGYPFWKKCFIDIEYTYF